MALYEKRELDANGNIVGLVLQGMDGCADLVAIFNMCTLKYSSAYGKQGPVTEAYLKSFISDLLKKGFDGVEDILPEQKVEIGHVISNIRTHFSLQPCLTGHTDFVINASYLLCRILKLPVFHGWVIDPESRSYDSLHTFCYQELVQHISTEDQQDQATLLDDSNNQLTSYGINSLPAELRDEDIALLFCRNQLNIIHKHCDVLFVLVTDEFIHKTMPEAVFMVFEEWCQERHIYLTEKYSPVKGQPLEQEARDWYLKFLQTLTKRQVAETLRKQLEDEQEDEARTKQQENEARMRSEKGESSQQGQSHDVVSKSDESNEGEDKDEPSQGDVKRAEALRSHNSGYQDDSRSSPDKAKTEAAQPVIADPEVDNMPQGVGSEFLSFLMNFKDDGCSEHYFKGIVAAFTLHCPMFYVPYPFIMAHDEKLALNIQDNYTKMSEDLKKSVVSYLSMNGVDFPNAILKIVGLPEPKSIQFFLDFLKDIDLHEHYVIYGAAPEALPSYESRRMALGYLHCIVAKFKTGRCWGGDWSEPNMKVKNKGSEFVIDCKEDYGLTSDLGFKDLTKFCTTVLEHLKFNGRFSPYFDELLDDMMLINDCFGQPGPWERFLELISYPMALKPPLVRASFICNVYLAGKANSTGDPPRYGPLFMPHGCVDWRTKAKSHTLLSKVFEYQNDRKSQKLRNILDIWAAKHWHVFKFSRHFIQHVLDNTKGEDLTQQVKDISEIDIILSRTIWKSIAKSVRYLVLKCGIDGIFSSAWRHYAGSDYKDKPNEKLEDTTTGDMMHHLLASISDEEVTPYVQTELSIHQSVFISKADLTDLQTKLNENHFKFELLEDHLSCGSISIRKHHYPATEESDGYTAIVVEGSLSLEYDAVYVFLIEWVLGSKEANATVSDH